MSRNADRGTALDPETAAFYRHAMAVLKQASVPFLVGGAYALRYYAGIERHTKDFDVFVRPHDFPRALESLAAAGYRTQRTFVHWLGKAFHGEAFVDIIFSSGNGLCKVDDAWFDHAVAGEAVGMPVRICPVEEIIWSKSFVIERERYDGADIIHLLHGSGKHFDWNRLLGRFCSFERVLLSHLLLYGFVYPREPSPIPERVLDALWDAVRNETRDRSIPPMLCQGTLLSREQYLIDIEAWGYQDARRLPPSAMTPEQIRQWTEGIDWTKQV
jgi:hypothetical protein